MLSLAICALCLNYLCNLVYLWIFCKYLKPFILHRQIDMISNYSVLAIGMLTSFYFCLLPFLNLFRHPRIQFQADKNLKPVHILLLISSILNSIPLSLGIILAINYGASSVLGMLGIDIVLISILCWIFCIAIIVVPKPEGYFVDVKKYTFQDAFKT